MIRLRAAGLAVLLLGACASEGEPVASLEVSSDLGTYVVTVHRGPAAGYPVQFECIEDCPQQTTYREVIGDHPLGLFSRDHQDDLVFYLTSSGSAHQVRAWQITESGIRPAALLHSRARPDFLSDAGGHALIQTYEGETNMGPLRPVRWTFRDGQFVRSPTDAS